MRIATTLQLFKLPVLGLVPEASATAPASPVEGQLWTDTSTAGAAIPKVYTGATNGWRPTVVYIGTTAGTVAAGDDSRIVNALQAAARGAADGVASLDASTKVPYAQLPTGTAASTVAAGDDARIVGAQQTSGKNVANGYAGLDGATKLLYAQIPVSADGAATASTLVQATDARLSNTRTPTDGTVTDAKVATNAAIAESKLNLASDAAANVASRRTLGLGALQAMPGNTNLSGVTKPSNNMDFNNVRLTNVGAPTLSTDAARLQDVQNAQAGIDVKPSVRVASTANVALASGVQNGAVIDGVTLATGDRVLLKNQTDATQNGSYVTSAAGTPGRTQDTITPNSFWFVEEGTVNADTSWVVTTNGTITIGTTAITLAQFGAPGTISGTANRITTTGNQIDIAANYVGQTSLTTLGTITTGTWNGTAVGVGFGGTGAADAAQARANLAVPKRGYAANLAALVAGTPLTVTHNLGVTDVIAQVRDTASGEYLYMDIIITGTNTLTVTSGIAFAAGATRIVVLPVL